MESRVLIIGQNLPRLPKETFDAATGGRSVRLGNFSKATIWTGRHSTTRTRGGQDKSQRAELAQFVEASLTGGAMPIPVEALVAVTRAAIAVRAGLSSGRPERV